LNGYKKLKVDIKGVVRFLSTDITISSKSKISKESKTTIVNEIYSTLYSKGYTPKRTKHEIRTNKNKMEVIGLTLIVISHRHQKLNKIILEPLYTDAKFKHKLNVPLMSMKHNGITHQVKSVN